MAPKKANFRLLGPRAFNKQEVQASLHESRKGERDRRYSYLDPLTEKRRDRVWKSWEEFAKCADIDPERIWQELCLNVPNVQDYFCTFLKEYLKASVVLKPCLGPDEYAFERTITSAATLQDAWCLLVNYANDHILLKKRIEDRDQASFWTLKYSSKKNPESCGPAYEIGRWIAPFAAENGLTLKQTFEKASASMEDIMTILYTVWERADKICCTPADRLSFSAYLVEMGLGGWRPGELANKSYRDVKFVWVRDPENPSLTRTVCWITVHHNKIKKFKIERHQRSRVKYALTVIPSPILCLTTMFAIRAITDDAFERGFKTCRDVLSPETLPDGIEQVELSWKREFIQEEKLIRPMNYQRFRKLWYRAQTVAGCRSLIRPYALRVGAIGRLDGCLQPAVRNFIVSHTTQMFEQSYQPVRLRANLANVAFGEVAKHDEALWGAITKTLQSRDPNAPTQLTDLEREQFEHRQDITELREELALEKVQEEKTLLRRRIRYILERLEKLLLQEKRRLYFQEVDVSRAEQGSALPLQEDRQNWTLHPQQSRDVHETKRNQRKKIPIIGRKYRKSSLSIAKLGSRLKETQGDFELAECLLAYLKEGLEGRNNDWNHPKLTESAFSDSNGKGRLMDAIGKSIKSSQKLQSPKAKHANPLFSHIIDEKQESIHGGNATALLSVSSPQGLPCSDRISDATAEEILNQTIGGESTDNKKPRCLLCLQSFSSTALLTSHVQRQHMESLEGQFTCPECFRNKKEDVVVAGGPTAWSAHVASVHGRVHAPNLIHPRNALCLLCNRKFTKRGFNKHLSFHGELFDQPFACPICLHVDIVTRIIGVDQWAFHVYWAHGGDETLLGSVLLPQMHMDLGDQTWERKGCKRKAELHVLPGLAAKERYTDTHESKKRKTKD